MMKSLSRTISKGSQSINYTELLSYDKNRLRVDIKSDSYLSQSYARVYIYDHANAMWNVLASIHFGAMRTEAGLCYLPHNRGESANHFLADRAELLRQAALILDLT